MNRRNFIKSAAALSAATAILGTGMPVRAMGGGGGKEESPTDGIDGIRNFRPDMQYRPHGRTGVMVSALGFGMLRLPMLEDRRTVDQTHTIEMLRYAIDQGVNYVDTAYRYLGGQSEEVVGKALAGGYRDKVYLATKLPASFMKSEADFDKFFDESRKRLQTDSIDFYLIHFMNTTAWNEQVVPFRLIEKMERLKQDGKVRFTGFSFHDSLVMFKKVVDANPGWDFCQIIQNYLDTEYDAGLAGLKYAAGRGLGVNCMQPLKNSFLVNPPAPVQAVFDAASTKKTPVEWALDYLWNMPEVSLALSGMGNRREVDENLEYARRSSVGMLSLQETTVIGEAAAAYRSLPGVVPCTGCHYCLPCPKGVAIGYLLGNIHYEYKAGGNKQQAITRYANVPPTWGVNASACDSCGTCSSRCPQRIDIPAVLKELDRELRG